MNILLNTIESMQLFEMANEMLKREIGLMDSQMILLRKVYNQYDNGIKTFIDEKYDNMDFLENYEGSRKRK